MSAPPAYRDQQPPAYTPTSGYVPPPPPGSYPPPPPGSYPQPTAYQGYQSGAPLGYQPSTNYIPAQPIRVTSTNVVVIGGCPACRIGILEDDFTLLGVCCAILFFPLGILCCLAMRQRRCPHCGAVFG